MGPNIHKNNNVSNLIKRIISLCQVYKEKLKSRVQRGSPNPPFPEYCLVRANGSLICLYG